MVKKYSQIQMLLPTLSGTLRRYNTLEVHLLIIQNKETGILTISREVDIDKEGGIIRQASPH